ncbi:unnamed protein product [Cladocopium goreaui]|uniref:Fe2OG dioxygenase domain-containing protein n=1 Tax=Cladocopium goreaui TaxID=2562237 RepID=A0A9P1C1G4_9DINO|nr:unnamed protein product [Cladocopium goreaui]
MLNGSTAQRRFAWPREALQPVPVERSPIWDHPEELEPLKQYTFREVSRSPGKALDVAQLDAYREDGFLLNLPVLLGEALATAREDFNQLLLERTERAADEDAKFRAAHTLARPLHQDLVQRLARHERVLHIVEAWRCLLRRYVLRRISSGAGAWGLVIQVETARNGSSFGQF